MGNAGGKPGASGQNTAGGQERPTTGFGYGGAFGGSSEPQPQNKVQIAVSVLAGIPGATAYHSSILVNGEEFSFSDAGISTTSDLGSHRNPQTPNSTPQVLDMGMSKYTGSQLTAALERHFLPGTYDMLKKNCNSFTDCALFYLMHKRLDRKYRSLEQIGASNPSLMQMVSNGQYKPNPKAENFDVEVLIKDVDPDKVWSSPGNTMGGTSASSAEAMRAARLARFGATPGGYPAQTGETAVSTVAPSSAVSGAAKVTLDPL